jgi:hypothetical protein
MKKFARTARGLALALGISTGAACASDGTSPPTGPTPEATTPLFVTDAQAELEALRGLDVIAVGDLLVALPSESSCAYTGPCPGWEDAAAAEIARQLPRLERLNEIAAQAAAAYDPAATAPTAAESAADLQALRELHIVDVQALIQEVPVAEANCYNLVCPGEEERIAAENRARAIKLAAIADAASDL